MSYAKDKLNDIILCFLFIGVTQRGQVFVRRETPHSHPPDPSAYQKKEVKQKAIREAMANPYKSGLAIAEDNFR